jgi:DNA-directed RNA polymerase specialized sigma24 family protein
VNPPASREDAQIGDVNDLRPRMMSDAYRLLGNLADAEDAVQDAPWSMARVE